MRVKTISLLIFSILTFSQANHHVCAMGSKDNPANVSTEKAAQPTGSKTELAEKFMSASKLLDFPPLTKLLAPLEEEFKALGIPAKPFDKTLNKLNEYLLQFIQPIMNIIKKPMIAQAVKYFTEDELKELILIYQKPVMQKQYDFMLTWILGPVFSALQDPAILAQYTQEFIGFGMSMALQNNPQEIKRKGEELGKIAKGELDSLQTSVKFESPEFKEKLKNRYKSIAAIIEGLDLSKISSGIDNLSKTIDGMIDPTLKAGALPAMPDSAFPAEPMPAQ